MVEVMEGIDKRNKITLAHLCLSRDKNFQTLSEAERLKLIDSALSFGRAVARGIENEFDSSDPREIADKMGLKVIGGDGGIQGTLLKRGEYRPKTKEIVIFRDSLSKLMREVSTDDLSDKIMKLLIAHELFHHLEHTRYGSTAKRLKIERSFGPMKMPLLINSVSEVSAQAFAGTLLDIVETPIVFDYLAYILYSSEA